MFHTEILTWLDLPLNLAAAWDIVNSVPDVLPLLAQQGQAAGEGAAVAGEGAAAAGEGAAGGAGRELTGLQRFLSNPFILPIGLFLLFYFIFILPERRRKAEEAKMKAGLKKNDRVVTIGGIHGTVVSTSPDTGIVTLRIDENGNTRIRVSQSAIATILGESGESKDASKEAGTETKDKS